MDNSSIPARDKNEKTIWERLGWTEKKRTVKAEKKPQGKAGGYLTPAEQKRKLMDEAGRTDVPRKNDNKENY